MVVSLKLVSLQLQLLLIAVMMQLPMMMMLHLRLSLMLHLRLPLMLHLRLLMLLMHLVDGLFPLLRPRRRRLWYDDRAAWHTPASQRIMT